MKVIKWIASNKFLIIAPLLTLISAVVFAYAYNRSEDRKTNIEAAQSYPTPTIKAVDKQLVGNQAIVRSANDYDKQQQYQVWFSNARGLSKVTIYDKQLERLTQNQSGGGGCGSTCKS